MDTPRVLYVRDLEDPAMPILGKFAGTIEDTVEYWDSCGNLRRAPEDCVDLVYVHTYRGQKFWVEELS